MLLEWFLEENRTAEGSRLGSRTGECMAVVDNTVSNRDRKGRNWEGIVAYKDELFVERELLRRTDLEDMILMT